MTKQKDDGAETAGQKAYEIRRSGKRGFAALGRAVAAQEQRSTNDETDVAEDNEGSVVPVPNEEEDMASRERPDPARCIVEAVLDTALDDDMRARLSGPEPLAVIIRVPAAAWVAPVETAIERLNPKARVYARDGSSKSGHKAEVGNGEVAAHLAKGRMVVGIAPSVATLPRVLAAGADITIDLKIDGGILDRAIALFVGDTVDPQRIDGLGTLDLHDIVSGFRAGSSAAEIVERIRRSASRLSSPRTDRLPRMEDAVEYGRARDWALALGREFADYKAGTLKWHEIGVGTNALFAGPPGLGKTYFCRVLSAHLGIPLVATSISELFATSAGYLDSVIKAVRETFAKAESGAPCAILFDEIDALPTRAALHQDARASSWWTAVVAEFLTLLDSAAGGDRPGVFVWAATNYADRVDPALIRPGRLDRVIAFAAPGPDGIVSIVRHHLAGDLADADLTAIGQIGIGRSPAELAAAVKVAKGAARTEKRAVRVEDLIEAMAPPVDLDASTLRRIADHEAGHAVTAFALDEEELVAIDLVGDSGAFGRTIFRRRRSIETRASIENRTIVHLGGRAAEVVVYDGDCAANAGGDESSDLALATRAIASLRLSTGLGGGLAYLGDPQSAMDLLRIDPNLRRLVDQDLVRLHETAVTIVRRHRAALDAIASVLVAKRHLSGVEARRIFADHPPAPG
ncbi:AAA family ATPase [Bradyrhizobium barranii subsp. barranii]|uniref:AAA family ATPase n=1 Tax=Bradyrhizobium barranii subsp. barranii TaxID=2823807 RepID=A0A7Z0Q932_9BRAD|nr:AAA family ATPase [Bradyrhizobium barranii]UEM13232.1 AAA family ATPase [Bradyrhizobium barranii subsp. barranii]UGX93852.1 AAA family ATPase [Bradyrhizobium barranii subsp. barranii]